MAVPIQQKEARSPKPPQAQEHPEELVRHSHSSSSFACTTLQDTWRVLDLGSSPSGLTSHGDSTPGRRLPSPGAAHGWSQEGATLSKGHVES
ncbi:Coiled-coil domain-containing protein 57 [Saguinus oedipus]|uniref:Coiled-coil domain-containing protein 57 n=1 Tax=Saguinus oedipus TaxID=9490 RepID=A0ABQ9VSR5_SAGOE|nr:Coiled-coil domain-containing protein 57 [Saguinus oedipus]